MVLKDMRAILFNFAKNAVTTLCLSTRDVRCSSELYTHARLENPSDPNSLSSLTSVRPRDRLTSTACVSGPDFTCAGAHATASCAALHEPRARCCVNPARSSKWLRPCSGLCPSSGAIFVAISCTHSHVP